MTPAVHIAEHLRLLLIIGGAALALLLFVLGFALMRYRKHAHRGVQEREPGGVTLAVWTILGVAILAPVVVSDLRVAFVPEATMTITVTGKVGAWSYGYPGDGDFRYESRRLPAARAAAYGQPYGFAADYPLVVPVGRVVEIRATAADIAHLWSVPVLGAGVRALPGRISRVWFRADAPGEYYGRGPAMAPVAIKVVPWDRYHGWLAWAKSEYAEDSSAPAEKGTGDGR